MRLAVAGFAAALALVATACGGDDDDRSSKIFVAPPWSGAETLEYRLDQKGVDNTATCTLKTESSGGDLKLTRICSDDRGNRDEGVATVDPQTLDPRASTRTVFDADDKRTTTHSVTYEGREANFVTKSGDKSRDTKRDLPEPTESSPDPGWYDDESLLWLVRGIRLEAGYEGSYTHVINAGQPRVLAVDVEVEERETVRVPAGEFPAWKVRVAREKSVYVFWVEEAPEHRVVKAQIEGSTYELTKAG